MDDVVSELRQLRGQGVFQPYRAPSWAGGEKAADGVGKTSTDRGKWNMCAPPNPWTAILPRTDTGLLLLVMATTLVARNMMILMTTMLMMTTIAFTR